MHHSTARQGGPFQQLLPIQCYRVLRALHYDHDNEAWGLGTYLLLVEVLP